MPRACRLVEHWDQRTRNINKEYIKKQGGGIQRGRKNLQKGVETNKQKIQSI